MKRVIAFLALALTGVTIYGFVSQTNLSKEENVQPSLTTIAVRVHNMDAMVAFYTEAFGAKFREVDTFGIKSQFGEMAGITLKLVPLRDSADFEGYGSHQPGFVVENVEAVIEIAKKHGGRQEGELIQENGRVHGAVRDPDGNTIELYQSE